MLNIQGIYMYRTGLVGLKKRLEYKICVDEVVIYTAWYLVSWHNKYCGKSPCIYIFYVNVCSSQQTHCIKLHVFTSMDMCHTPLPYTHTHYLYVNFSMYLYTNVSAAGHMVHGLNL